MAQTELTRRGLTALAAPGVAVPGRAAFAEQAAELDKGKRTATLHKIQQILHERSVYAPLRQLAFDCAPYEDVTIKNG